MVDIQISRVGSGRVGSGRVGSGRVGSGRVGSGRVGSGRVGSDHPDSIRPAKFPGIFSAVGLQYRRMSRYIEVHDFISEPLSSVRELALFLFFAGGRGGRPGGLVRFSCSTRQPCAGMLLLDDVGEERGQGGERRVCATHIKRVCFCGGSGGGTKSDTYHPQRTNIMA